MADLEAAASEALETIRALASSADGARARVSALEDRVGQLRDQVRSDRDHLDETARRWSAATADEASRIALESDEAGAALVGLKGDTEEASGSGASELQASQDHTSSVAERFAAAEPQVAQMRLAIEETALALAEQATDVAEQLEQSLSQAQEFLAVEVTAGLQALADDVEERGRILGETLEQGESTLREAFQAWSDGLDRVDGVLQAESAAIADELTENVDLACDRCADAYRSALEAAGARVQEIEAVLRDVEAAAVDADSGTTLATEGMEQGMSSAAEGWLAVQRALESVKALLARYTFVPS